MIDVPARQRTVHGTMSPVAGITSVETRITAIRSRFAPGAPTVVDVSQSHPDTTGFDPFGAAYQAALDSVQMAPAPSAAAVVPGVMRLESYGSTGFAPVASGVRGVPGASIGRIGGFGPMTPPAELAAYGNGRVPTDSLIPIGQGGHRLYGPAATAWKSAVEAAAADGVSLRITDSYRSFDEQVDLVRRKGLYSEGGFGATPGTSNHGWGLAVDADVSDPATLAWIRANGWKFGFVEAVPREPWHWEFRPDQA